MKVNHDRLAGSCVGGISVHWGINPPSLKNTTPLIQQTAQAPPFRQSPLYSYFMNPPPP